MAKPNNSEKFNRYHYETYFPDNFPVMMLEFVTLFEDIEVDCTSHAAGKMINEQNNPRGVIPYPTNRELFDNSNIVIEYYELLNHPGRIQKAVIRTGIFSEKYDYTYVVARDNTIITCWANDVGDKHRLTKSLLEYVQKP